MTDVPRPGPPITEQLIAALVPATVIPQPVAAPLPVLPARTAPEPSGRGPVVIATCVPDRSGRVGAAPLLAALAWHPGDRVTVDVVHGSVVVTASRTGRHVIGPRGDIGLPAAVRTMTGIGSGQPVLMAALPSHGLLVIHPTAAITRLLARLHDRIIGGLHDR